MKQDINIDAVIGLAVSTSMVSSGYDQDAKPADLENQDAWNDVIQLTFHYLKWVGLDCSAIEIDKYVIAQCFWGMDEDNLNEALSDYEEEDFSY